MFPWFFSSEPDFKPEFMVVKYRSNYFPIRIGSSGKYDIMLNITGKDYTWKQEGHPESISLSYENLHGVSSLDEAINTIEKSESIEVKQIKLENFEPYQKGKLYFFDEKEKVIEWEKNKTEGMTVDELIDYKFSRDEILNTKVGAERTAR